MLSPKFTVLPFEVPPLPCIFLMFWSHEAYLNPNQRKAWELCTRVHMWTA